MTRLEVNKIIKEMKKFTRELKGSKEKCKQFLIGAGIIDKNCRLKKQYK